MTPQSNPPLSPATLNRRDLQTAGHTMIDAVPKPDALFERVMRGRGLIEILGLVPTVPSLVYQDPVSQATLCQSIGTGLSVGRWSYDQDKKRGADLAFPTLTNMSRPHFEVRVEEGFHILVNHGTAGTQVNGNSETVTEHVLRSGDIVYAAGATFVFTRGSHD